jgi:hypothetical protein
MIKQKTKIVQPPKLMSVRVYFTDKVLMSRIEKLSQGMGVSVSAAVGMAVRSGIDEVEKAMEKITGEYAKAKNSPT